MERNHNKNLSEHWTRSAVVYQIYPRSFKDSNRDGIGDLKGIINKLDYLNDGTEKSLGIGAIWLNPIYASPMKDFGYDISDYRKIDPVFGTLDDFDRLIVESHKRGIKVLMDFVPNHTSDEHPWFKESRSSRDNKKRDWYIWRDPKSDARLQDGQGGAPNNWLSVFGGSAWTRDDATGQYYMHSFLPSQPDLNWRNQEVRDEMGEILRFWLKKGVDGFRTDAVYHLIKDDKFRDDPPNPNYVAGRNEPYDSLLHIYSQGRPELIETANAICNILGEHSNDAYMVSEAYLDLPHMIELYKACDNGLHAPFNFNLMTLPWSGESFKKFIDEFEARLGPNDWPNYTFGNHDRSRVATRLGQARARLAAALQFALRGMPFIYYGDELGMEDVSIAPETIRDPWGKNVPGFNVGRDPERTPMQWDASPHAGFSAAKPWLPIAGNYKTINVSAESDDPRSMLNFYRTLIHVRAKSEALLSGAYRPLNLQGNGNVFSFIREHGGEGVFVAINFSDEEYNVSFSQNMLFGFSPRKCRIVCNTGCDSFGEDINIERMNLRPYEATLITLQK